MSRRVLALLGLGVTLLGAVALAFGLAGRDEHPETVIVPRPEYGDLVTTFDRLRRRGLRVAIPERIRFDATSAPGVRSQHPATGSPVRWGIVVELELRPGMIGSPSVPNKMPTYRVPDFTGEKLSGAVAWTKGKWVYWEADLPPLPASSAQHLFDAYVVTGQRPRAGSQVHQGILMPHGIRLTPLVLEVRLR